MHTHRSRRGMTLIEVVVASAVFSIVLLALAGVVRSSGDTSSLVHAQTAAQLRAEDALRIVRDQLRRAGEGGQSDLQVDPAPTAPGAVWEISYRVLQDGQLFDPAATDPYATLPWSADRFVLRFERSEDPANGLDDDGDLVIDDGHVALYRRPATGPDQLVAVLAKDLADFRVERQIDVRPRLHLEVEVQKVPHAAVRNIQDVTAVRAGGGPRVTHTADIWLTLPN